MQKRLKQTGTFLMLGCLLTASSCDSPVSIAEPYPNRPIEVIVPFAPGGGSDTFARIIKAEVDQQKLLPHPLVIINAPGAGGTVGSRRVMNEKPDGYTVLLLHDGILTAKHSGKVLYGPNAFEQVAGTGQTGMVIAVHDDAPYESLTDLLTAAATELDSITFAANLGAPSHFIGLIIEQEHGSAKFRFAQSGGGADRYAALKGKHAEVTAFSLEEYIRFKPDGIKALAYLGQMRHKKVPDLATAIEQGINVKQSVMQYWWMPKGTPPQHAKILAGVLQKAMRSENVMNTLSSLKIDPLFISGDELTSHLIESDIALSKVDPGTESPLPNVPLVLASLTGLFGVLVSVQRLRGVSEIKTESKPINNDWRIVFVSAVLVTCYAVGTIVFGFSLGLSTSLFLIAMGFLLTNQARKFNPWMVGMVLLSSVGVGILFHVVFTKLFEIGL